MKRKLLLFCGTLAVLVVAGTVVLAIVGSVSPKHEGGAAMAGCTLPSGDRIVAAPAVCTKLGGSRGPAQQLSAEALYAAWKASNRTAHNRAYAAAEIYLKRFPQGPHAHELQSWATAYQNAMRMIALAEPTSLAKPGGK